MVDFNVINDGNEVFPDDVSAAVESSPVLSPLSSLRSRREQIVNDLFTDIQVPRWDEPEIFVRFKPVDTCLALFLTEGDLLEVANKVVKWSGIANDEADETF